MPRFVRRQRERQDHPNWVAGLHRNRWPTSVGTGGRIASESVAGLARITHALVFKLVDGAQKNWRTLDGHNQLPKIIQGVKFADGLEVVAKPIANQAQTAAA